MKVSELEGAELDYFVAKVEDRQAVEGSDFEFPKGELVDSKERFNWSEWDCYARSYSSDWSQGGPIIEREKIQIIHPLNRDYCEAFINGQKIVMKAKLPLIAAMRAYVASKFGEEINETL